MKLSVADLVNLSPQELIKKMQASDPAKEEEMADETVAGEVPAPQQVTVNSETPTSTEEGFNKKLLKGLFAADTQFAKGQKIEVSGTELEVLSVETSSGRIKFKVSSTGEVFSASAAALKGGKEELPYKKGDKIVFENTVFEVLGLNPANRNVVIADSRPGFEGKKRYVKISKVMSYVNENPALP